MAHSAIEVIEVEGTSVNEVRDKIKAQMAINHCILSETIIDDGESRNIRERDVTVDTAYSKALSKLEGVVEIISKDVLSEPSEKAITVQAFDEQTAQALAKKQITYSDSIKSLSLAKRGSRGFLGIGKTPHHYNVLIFSPAQVIITYRRPVRISVKTAENRRNEMDNHKLTDYESKDQPFDLTCERCKSHCRALGRPVADGTVMVMTPRISQRAARFCEKCCIIICGSCAGVNSHSLGVGGIRECPRCGSEPIFAAACHVRATVSTIL
jgi:hypothetical protein